MNYYISFFNKWLHLFSIVGVLGGILFALLVLVPALRANPEDVGSEAREVAQAIWKRFGMILGILWLVVLVTGFLNLYIVTPQVNKHYQMYAGIKMLLALGMFGLSLRAVQQFFPNRSTWLLLLSALGVVILGLSAHMNLSRINGRGLKQTATATVKSGKGRSPLTNQAPISKTVQ